MRKLGKVDIPLAVMIFATSLFGWIMVASLSGPASYDRYTKVFQEECPVEEVNCNNFFMWQHFYYLLLGMFAWGVAMVIPYRFWAVISPVIFLGGYILLMMTIFSPWGVDHNTFAKNWLDLPGLPAFQPVELAKVCLILYLAQWMAKRTEAIRTLQNGFVPFAILTSMVVVPLVLQPDFGSALIVAVVAAVIYFVAGARISHLLVGAMIVVSIVMTLFSFYPYLQQRFETRFTRPADCKTDECWQSYQSLVAIGSGGIVGMGYNASRQKHNWLPEIKSDYIFAGIAEELGFMRTVFVIFLYCAITYRGYLIAMASRDRFARLTAMGIVVMLSAQAFLHIGVNLDVVPVTGVTLPLISNGGSSLVSTLFALGILLNISRYCDQDVEYFSRRRRIGRARAA